MPKRNHVTEDSITTTKRARTTNKEMMQSPRRGLQKGASKGRLGSEDEVQDDAEDEGDDEEEGEKQPQLLDDEEFEAKYGAALRAHLEKKRNIQGASLLNIQASSH